MNRKNSQKRPKTETSCESGDEQLDILQKSSHAGMVAGLVVCLVLTVIKMVANQQWQDLFCIYCTAVCGQYGYKWFRTKNISMLICALLWGAGALALLISYLVSLA